MNRRKILAAAAVISLVLILAGGYIMRGQLRDVWADWNKPELPPAEEYRSTGEPETRNAEREAADAPSSELQAPTESLNALEVETNPDPLAWSGELPTQVNLAVPFLLQAPSQNWSQPFGDACEEASLIMVDAFYDGRKANFGIEEGESAILDVVAFEDEAYGHNKDTTTPEVARTAMEYFGYGRALVRPVSGPEDIKAALAHGYPVIVPAHGKSLFNPNFRNGGPEYHMLVIKGYTADGKWITNDPGTRRGADYIYTNTVLMNAIHSYHPEGMLKGAKEMIVILPSQQ